MQSTSFMEVAATAIISAKTSEVRRPALQKRKKKSATPRKGRNKKTSHKDKEVSHKDEDQEDQADQDEDEDQD